MIRSGEAAKSNRVLSGLEQIPFDIGIPVSRLVPQLLMPSRLARPECGSVSIESPEWITSIKPMPIHQKYV